MTFRSGEVHRLCTSSKEMDRRLGESTAEKLRLRLAQIEAADCLDDLAALPQVQCHNLDKQRRFRVDVTAGVAVVLEPTSDDSRPVSKAEVDWSEVTSVLVVAVNISERRSDG